MSFNSQNDSIRQRMLLGILALIVVTVGGWQIWSWQKNVPTLGVPMKPLESMSGALSSDRKENENRVQPGSATPSDTQRHDSSKLTAAENAAISERMMEAKRLLDALDVTNAKQEMDYTSDTRHAVVVRIEAPTVEQLVPIYDLLSKASKDFPADTEAAKTFCSTAWKWPICAA